MIHFLELESLSAFSLGCYGEQRYPTPTFDAIATQSFVSNSFLHGSGELLANLDESNVRFQRTRWQPVKPDVTKLLTAAEYWVDVASLEEWKVELPEERTAEDFQHSFSERFNAEMFRLIESTAITIDYDSRLLEFFEDLDLDDEDVLVICGCSGDSLRVPKGIVDQNVSGTQQAVDAETNSTVPLTRFHLPLIIFLVSGAEHHRIFETVTASDLERLCSVSTPLSQAGINHWIDSLNPGQVSLTTSAGILVQTPEWFLFDPVDHEKPGQGPSESSLNSESDSRRDRLQLFLRPEDLWGNLNVASQFPLVIEHYLKTGELVHSSRIATEHEALSESEEPEEVEDLGQA